MAIVKDVLDQLLAGRNTKGVFSKDALVDELKKALSERILTTELDEYLAAENAAGQSNQRNGYSKKAALTTTSKMTVAIPRDPAGTFDPQLIAKISVSVYGFRRQDYLDVHARHERAQDPRPSRQPLRHRCLARSNLGGDHAVLEELAEWQNQPLDAYPLVFFDALRVKIRDEGFVRNNSRLHHARRHARRHQKCPRTLD